MKLAILIIGVLVFIPETQGSNLIMPKELNQFAKKKGCSQVSDFFSRPGKINPPYVYGYMYGKEKNSAIFWCKRESAKNISYIIHVMVKKENKKMNKCPREIEWPNYPGGLSLVGENLMTLDGFKYLRHPKQQVSITVKAEHKTIRSEYDGVSTYFYCNNGKWIFKQTH